MVAPPATKTPLDIATTCHFCGGGLWHGYGEIEDVKVCAECIEELAQQIGLADD